MSNFFDHIDKIHTNQCSYAYFTGSCINSVLSAPRDCSGRGRGPHPGLFHVDGGPIFQETSGACGNIHSQRQRPRDCCHVYVYKGCYQVS